MARLLDGVRHLQTFGYWSSTGMTWQEVCAKYRSQTRAALGPNASEEAVQLWVYQKIIERACETNAAVDQLAIEASESETTAKRNVSVGEDAGRKITEQENRILSRCVVGGGEESWGEQEAAVANRLSIDRKAAEASSSAAATAIASVELGGVSALVMSHVNAAGALVLTALSSRALSLSFLEDHISSLGFNLL